MDRGTQALITTIVFTVLAGIFIILRSISRFFVVKRPGVEDYLIIFAFILSIGLCINVDLQKDNGLGKHTADLALHQVVTTLKLLYASIVIYNLGLLTVKASLLFQYQRIFVARPYRIAAWVLMGIIWVGGITLILVCCFSCKPVAFFWDASLEKGTCFNMQPLWYTISGFQLATDFAVLALPIPVLVKLQLPRKQKITLVFVFLLGGFACIVSILRLHGLYAATISKDLTFDNARAVTWSAVEFNTGIICSCFAAMRPLITALFPRLLGTTRRTAASSNPFPPGSQSRAYYQPNDSTVELSRTAVSNHRSFVPKHEWTSSDEISFDTATRDPGIHVKQEWSVSDPRSPSDAESGTLGRAY